MQSHIHWKHLLANSVPTGLAVTPSSVPTERGPSGNITWGRGAGCSNRTCCPLFLLLMVSQRPPTSAFLSPQPTTSPALSQHSALMLLGFTQRSEWTTSFWIMVTRAVHQLDRTQDRILHLRRKRKLEKWTGNLWSTTPPSIRAILSATVRRAIKITMLWRCSYISTASRTSENFQPDLLCSLSPLY